MVDSKYEKHTLNAPFLPFKLHKEALLIETKIYSHWHENVEMLYCLDGSGIVHLDAETVEFGKGDIVVVNSKCLHSIDTDKTIKYWCLIVDIEFFRTNGIKIDSIVFNKKINDIKAIELMKNIGKSYQSENEFYGKAEKRLSVLEYVLYLCKNYSHKRKDMPEHKIRAYAAVLDAVEYINLNFSQHISIDELAEMTNYSKYHFSRLFKENTGLTIIEQINKRRCDHARILLRDTNKSVSQICFECGFDTPSYFTKEFKELYGILPSDYRKENQEK